MRLPYSSRHSQAFFQEAFAAEVVLVDALFLQLRNDLHFGCNAGVIRAGLPQSFKALHTLPADKNILQGVVECVSHMQAVR